MISPAKLDKLPSEVVNLVQELQEQIIRDVCRRVTKANYLTPTAEWQLYKANQLRLSYNEVNKRIARQLKVRERTVQELYTETVKQALKEDADIYRIAAAEGKLPANTGARIDSYFRSAALSKLLSKGLKNAKGQLRNLCNSMAAEANRALSDAMDLAHLKVISGAYSYDDAIYSAVKELSDKGITRVTYPSGRRDNVDVCVRRAVLSSVNKSCCDIQLDLAHEVGSRYVEVTAHIGARPSHAEWQGQIYSLEKGDPKYPYFYDATGYGTGEGLGGWNCRHNFFPYFEGIDTPYHTPEFTKNENNEYYALTQKQRGYERAVRDSKRKLAALDGARQSAEDPALRAKLDRDFARRAVTLKNREARLEKFIKDNDLQRDNSRVRVVGFGKSVSRKAVAAAENDSSINNIIATVKNKMLPSTATKYLGQTSVSSMDYILKVYGQEHADAMKNMVDFSDEHIRKAWIAFEDKIKTYDASYNGDKAHYSRSKDGVLLNMGKVSKGTLWNKPYQTAFHEFGHNIDYEMNMIYGTKDKFIAFSEAYGANTHGGLLGRTIKQEVNEHMEKAKVELISKGINPSKQDIYKYLSQKLKAESPIKIADVSDMFDGATNGKVKGNFSHSGNNKNYWRGRDNSKEVFAEMFSASICNPESLEQIKAYFPKSYNVFIEILEVI